MPPILVLGTRNAKKRQEIEEILGDLGIPLQDLSQYPDAHEVVRQLTLKAQRENRKLEDLAFQDDDHYAIPSHAHVGEPVERPSE